ncbi:GGDEF domain-containing protein [Rhodoferax sp. 4810]|uniref:diguanylate cyclase n=1 Tax=Thiospirillum jenense TaxID=1653858 RepID=A0A839HFL6_9GAMM|nr:GGDEF domain-containing protein [Thiospirillum jenense]MBB1073500.1 GGDEF domain-containing protein [Rhodoferax jenense]MBB1125988.1 GGDEF domain-containing protein [Thiospirillum jenense]
MHTMTYADTPHLTLVTASNEMPLLSLPPVEPIQFLQAIISTLDPHHAFTMLNHFLMNVIHHTGWEYYWTHVNSIPTAATLRLSGGKTDRHSLEYTLVFNDREMGVLKLMRGRRFTEAEQTHIEALIGLAAPALHNALQFHELNAQLERDVLTELGNRRALMTQGQAWLADCERQQRPASMLALDLDKFKLINDQYGHPTGDRVLIAVAQVLRQVTRAADLCVRMGGDEFVILLPGADIIQAMECAERLRHALTALVLTTPEGQTLNISASIGLATYRPGYTLQQLYEKADAALYAAKHAGYNQVLVGSRSAAAHHHHTLVQ